MGISTAYNLKKSEEKIKVAVVEMDSTYSRASSTLSLANVRIQFSLKENIQISQHAFEVLERFDEEMAIGDEKPNIAFHREGNLFLVAPEGRALAEKALALQKSVGCDVSGGLPRISESIILCIFLQDMRRDFWAERRASGRLCHANGL